MVLAVAHPSGPLGALLSSPALDVRLMTALQVLQVLGAHGLLRFRTDGVLLGTSGVGERERFFLREIFVVWRQAV